jgi:hypothetical protein
MKRGVKRTIKKKAKTKKKSRGKATTGVMVPRKTITLLNKAMDSIEKTAYYMNEARKEQLKFNKKLR